MNFSSRGHRVIIFCYSFENVSRNTSKTASSNSFVNLFSILLSNTYGNSAGNFSWNFFVITNYSGIRQTFRNSSGNFLKNSSGDSSRSKRLCNPKKTLSNSQLIKSIQKRLENTENQARLLYFHLASVNTLWKSE